VVLGSDGGFVGDGIEAWHEGSFHETGCVAESVSESRR
jgi:hypothetical protein